MPLEYVPLWTFADAVEHLIDGTNATGIAEERRKARRAVIDAYREFPQRDEWGYFTRPGQVTTQASQSDGTFSYDHCVTPEHEALTRKGWKTYDQLAVGDEILAYDHDSETCSWQQIQNLHTFQYSGKILDVQRKGRSVLRCTPNHRVPVFERCGGTKTRRLRKKWVLAKDLTMEHTTPLAAPLCEEVAGPLTPTLASILAWAVTDGSGMFRKWSTPQITQSATANPDKCAEIASITGAEPYTSRRDDCVSYPVRREDYRRIRACVRSKDELVELFCRFGVAQSEAVVRAMILAEASTNPNGQKVFTQWGQNKPVAEAFQVACVLAGKAANISTRQFRCRSFGKDEYKTRYQCPLRHSSGIKLAKQSRWVPYDGLVWCPQVRTGAWVVRCNGAVMVTGNSGGAEERLVTLTGATVPTDGAWFTFVYSNVEYQIERVISSTTFTLTEFSNPGADIAAGASYSMFRSQYPVPINWRMGSDPIQLSGWGAPCYVSPSQLVDCKRYNNTAQGWQQYYTIRGSDQQYSGFVFEFQPPPSEAKTYQFVYSADPRPIGMIGSGVEYSTGTVAVSGTTVTGTTTAFTSRMIGCVIRFTSGSVVPTGTGGKYSSAGTADNPYDEQRIITAVASATSLTIDQAVVGTYSGKMFSIGDPLDLDYHVMLDAFKALCEWKFAQIISKDMEYIGGKEAEWKRQFGRARAADYRRPERTEPVPTPIYARLLT